MDQSFGLAGDRFHYPGSNEGQRSARTRQEQVDDVGRIRGVPGREA
jgi:hypothetical protein